MMEFISCFMEIARGGKVYVKGIASQFNIKYKGWFRLLKYVTVLPKQFLWVVSWPEVIEIDFVFGVSGGCDKLLF